MEYLVAIIWVSSGVACLDSWFRFCKKDNTPISIVMIIAIPIAVIAPFIACTVFFINQLDDMENRLSKLNIVTKEPVNINEENE